MRAQTRKAIDQWNGRCSAEIAATVLAGAWKPSIIHQLDDHGVLRFGELGRLNPGLSDRGLTRVLGELVDDGLVERTEYPQVPPKVEYRLTARGEGAQRVLDVMAEWGRDFADGTQPGPTPPAGNAGTSRSAGP